MFVDDCCLFDDSFHRVLDEALISNIDTLIHIFKIFSHNLYNLLKAILYTSQSDIYAEYLGRPAGFKGLMYCE